MPFCNLSLEAYRGRVSQPDGPQGDGKRKNQHCRERLLSAKTDRQLQAKTVLMDSWYASTENLQLLHRLGMVFITPLQENRLVSLSKERGCQHLDTLEVAPETLQHGQWVKLKELPVHGRLFKRVAPNGDMDRMITHRPDDEHDPQNSITAEDVQEANAPNAGRSKRGTALPSNSSVPNNAHLQSEFC